MKKRLPSIVVIGGALLCGLIIFLWPYLHPTAKEVDTDGDTFIDRIDNCPEKFSKSNMGCPEKKVLGQDSDKDGKLFGFQKDTSMQDPDDGDPCNPNPTCAFCDTDGDGLTYPQELKKRSNPENADSDGDGVIDGQDLCILEYGLNESKGCPKKIDIGLNHKKNQIIWNPEVNLYAEDVKLVYYRNVDGQKYDEVEISVIGRSNISIEKYKPGAHYDSQIIVQLHDPKAVKTFNSSVKW